MAFSKIGAYQYYTSIGDTETASKYSSTDAYGTVNNPMVIRNIYEFGNTGSSDITQDHFYMIMVKDINMDNHPELDKLYGHPFLNKIQMSGYSKIIHIDFNGYCIRNIIVRNQVLEAGSNWSFIYFIGDSGRIYLNNVRLENLIISNLRTSSDTTSTGVQSIFGTQYNTNNIIVNNMYVSCYYNKTKDISTQFNRFTLIHGQGRTVKIFNLYTKFSGTINQQSSSTSTSSLRAEQTLLCMNSTVQIFDWTIDFRNFYWIDQYSSQESYLFYTGAVNIDTVHIVGTINRVAIDTNINFKRSYLLYGSKTPTNIICDANINFNDYASSFESICVSNNSSSFINKDKVTPKTCVSSEYNILCTTEQLKDPAFLTQNGLVFMQT